MYQKVMVASILLVLGWSSPANSQEFQKPSAEHELLLKDVGEWSIEGKMLFPGGAFQEFTGEEKVEAIGKFWTVSHYSSGILGGLTGSATMGYDPKSKQFVGTWVDSFQPAVTHMTGSYDKATKTMTYKTKGIGMDGKPLPGKIVIEYHDKDSHTFTMYHQDPTGQSDLMVKTMEMTYTRKVDE